MRTTVIHCDRCHEPTDQPIVLEWLGPRRDKTDLCPACAEQFRAWLEADRKKEATCD